MLPFFIYAANVSAWVEALQRETELFPTCFRIMVQSRAELDHEAVLHYLFCLWRDLQGCRVGNGRRLARSNKLLSLWCHAGKLVRPQAEGV
jgi:hypothetical protein